LNVHACASVRCPIDIDLHVYVSKLDILKQWVFGSSPVEGFQQDFGPITRADASAKNWSYELS
jgi:hypothetical protein